jgi:penicillin-binding protein 1A
METWPDPEVPLGRRLRDFAGSLLAPRRMASVVLAAFFVAGLAFAVAWQHCFFGRCPDVASLTALQPDSSPVLLDRDGHPFADLAQHEQRVARLHNLPQHVAQAFLAVEDQRFYEHRGIDWRRVGGAVLANLRSGGFGEGFSTLSMQLARNVFPEEIPGQERSARRKLLEVRVAQEIEDSFTKDEILELYLNHIYFGSGAHGIEAAARQYFGIPARQLGLAQAALLAALPKAPSHYDPHRNPERARERRNLVLTLMERQGRISAREAREARESPLGITAPALHREEIGVAPWFVAEVRRELEEHFGDSLYSQPLLVHTTLDRQVQQAAERELATQLQNSGEPRGAAGRPDLEGAVVVLRVADGDVLGWVGGRDWAISQFDRVVHAERQPGSAWKPFVYAAALEAGYPLSQPLPDRPMRVRFADGRVWVPKDFGDRYDGEVTLRDALVRSKNVPTVHLAQTVGLPRVADLARRAGIAEPVPELPSSALGTVALSPLELTAAYTTFAGLGTRVEPRLIQRVERLDGTLLWAPPVRRHPVLAPAVAYLVNNILGEAVERGSGAGVRKAGFAGPAAGKTGTTNEGTDAWFVGYTPELAAGVWIGYDHPRPISVQATGGEIAAPLWGRLMRQVYADRPVPAAWKRPSGVVERAVDPASGRGLAAGCAPAQGTAYRELFLAGREPQSICPAPAETSRVAAAAPPVAAPPAMTPPETTVVSSRRAPARAPVSAGDSAAGPDLSGWWEITNQIQTTSYAPYEGLRLTYRIRLVQDGDRLVGRGIKSAENGRPVGAAAQTPITLSGTVFGRTARLLFTERGLRRTTQGSFRFKVAPRGETLSGTFASSAADTRGPALGRRAR